MENRSVSKLLDKYKTGKRARPLRRDTGKGNPRSARHMRARIGNRPARIDREESVSSDSAVETGREEALESRKYNNIMAEGESANDNMRSESAKACESLGGTLVIWGQTGSEGKRPAEMHKKQDSDVGLDSMHVIEDRLGESEKLEQMVDPLHAMLLDMIPSLSQRNVEGQSCSLGGEKQQQQDFNGNPVKKVDGEKEQLNVDANPVKKKVSYKDVAGQLLEDWRVERFPLFKGFWSFRADYGCGGRRAFKDVCWAAMGIKSIMGGREAPRRVRSDGTGHDDTWPSQVSIWAARFFIQSQGTPWITSHVSRVFFRDGGSSERGKET
ncbi:hypothetical protein BHM03_00053613 [Ensete ventricosum]|nr:hypothetical protein BHM03_00053613 [Ensete ventricosum]